MSGALLCVSALEKHFARAKGLPWRSPPAPVRAVDGVDFEIGLGESLGLVGESGSGKSTTAYCALGLLRPTAGEVRFLGKNVTRLKGAQLRTVRREMQIVFQDPFSSLNPRMRVGAIIAEPLSVHGVGTRRARQQRVRALLELVGLEPGSARRYPHEFSGGQRQRIAVARAIALEPKLVVCDEPVSALDVSVQAQILNLLKDLQRDIGLSYLFISHDIAVVRAMSDQICVMREGRIIEHGSAAEVFVNPKHDYTKELLACMPVPELARMRERKATRGRA